MAAALGPLTAKLGLDAGGFIGTLGKAAGKAREFGSTVGKAMAQAKENVLPLWAGLQLVQQAVSLILGPSEVLNDIFGAFQDIWSGLVDSILAAFEPVWMPLIKIFQEIVVKVLPTMLPLLKAVAKVLGDVLIPILIEFQPEFELMLKAFVLLLGLGLVVFFVVLAGALVLAGGAVRPFRLMLEALIGVIGGIGSAVEQVAATFQWFFGLVAGGFNAVASFGRNLANAIIGAVEWALNWIVDAINTAFGWSGVKAPHVALPRLERGGLVTKTGMAEVHAGEWFSGVGGGAPVTLNFYDGAIRLGGTATADDARAFVDMVREELRQNAMSAVNTLR